MHHDGYTVGLAQNHLNYSGSAVAVHWSQGTLKFPLSTDLLVGSSEAPFLQLPVDPKLSCISLWQPPPLLPFSILSLPWTRTFDEDKPSRSEPLHAGGTAM